MAIQMIRLQCSLCKKLFQRPQWQYKNQVKNGNTQIFCGRKCFGKYSGQKHKNNLVHIQKYTAEIKKYAQEMRIFGMSYKSIANALAKELNIDEFPSGSVSYLVRLGK